MQEKKPGESIDSLLRRFKRKIKTDGIIQEVKRREYFEKPSDERKRKLKAAQRRTKQQQRASEL